jgi:Uma2 family endonuclease
MPPAVVETLLRDRTMSTSPEKRYSPEEYLALERRAEHKSQFFDGEIFAMSGASRRHNLIAMNIGRELSAQLKGRTCEVYPSDMRVKVSPTGLYTYPDVVVVCGEPRFEDDRDDTLLNPTVVIEVLSPSTEDYDRGRKAEQYRQIESLAEYVLVAQDRHHVEIHRRQKSGEWLLWETNRPDDTAKLRSIGCELPLVEMYDKVEIDENDG